VNAPGQSEVMVSVPAKFTHPPKTTLFPKGGPGQMTIFEFLAATSAKGQRGDVATTLKIHDPDPTAPSGSNSQTGTTLAIQQGKRRLLPDPSTASGYRWIGTGKGTPKDASWQADMNASHIPIFRRSSGSQ